MEINDLISAAKTDLLLSGVNAEKTITVQEDQTPEPTEDDPEPEPVIVDVEVIDPLIKRAIITYVKANFGWNNPDAEKLKQSYEMLKSHLSLSAEYAYCAVTFEVMDGDTPIRMAMVTIGDKTKYTDANGKAVIYLRAGNNYVYTVTHEDYEAYEEVEGEVNLLDVTGNDTVSISLAAL